MLSNSIFSTLLYHSIFDYPLTFDEIYRYLIFDSSVSLPALKKEISSLLKTGKIISIDDFFVPSSLVLPPAIRLEPSGDWRAGRPSSLVALRQRRKRISQKKLIIAKRASRIISIIPGIKMIAVTGALTMENADENDDIDLMVVASRNRLWIVRLLVMMLVSVFFKRRKPSPQFNPAERDPALQDNLSIKQFSNSICLNLWLDEAALEIPVGQRNLYTAHELAQMKPIVNKNGIYERMMWENRWGRKYLANVWEGLKGWQVSRSKKPNRFNLFNLLNLLAFNLQFKFMQSKITNERVSLHAAFFHPGNRADTILDRYDRLCQRSF